MLHHEPGSGTDLPRRPARRTALVFVLLIVVICGAVVRATAPQQRGCGGRR